MIKCHLKYIPKFKKLNRFSI